MAESTSRCSSARTWSGTGLASLRPPATSAATRAVKPSGAAVGRTVMEVIARARYIRRAPRKARLVADTVRGMRVVDALAQLEFSPKHAARDVAKAIKSAAANAEHNFNLNRDDLVLKQLLIDEGPTFRRRRPVSRSMAHEYFHRTCHITAVVEDQPQQSSRGARR